MERVLFKQELNEGLGENKVRIWLSHTLWIPIDHDKNNFLFDSKIKPLECF